MVTCLPTGASKHSDCHLFPLLVSECKCPVPSSPLFQAMYPPVFNHLSCDQFLDSDYSLPYPTPVSPFPTPLPNRSLKSITVPQFLKQVFSAPSPLPTGMSVVLYIYTLNYDTLYFKYYLTGEDFRVSPRKSDNNEETLRSSGHILLWGAFCQIIA